MHCRACIHGSCFCGVPAAHRCCLNGLGTYTITTGDWRSLSSTASVMFLWHDKNDQRLRRSALVAQAASSQLGLCSIRCSVIYVNTASTPRPARVLNLNVIESQSLSVFWAVTDDWTTATSGTVKLYIPLRNACGHSLTPVFTASEMWNLTLQTYNSCLSQRPILEFDRLLIAPLNLGLLRFDISQVSN